MQRLSVWIVWDNGVKWVIQNQKFNDSKPVGDHSFSMYVKFYERLTLFTSW